MKRFLALVVALHFSAASWWAWQVALEWLTPMGFGERATFGFVLAAATFTSALFVASDRGWFKK